MHTVIKESQLEQVEGQLEVVLRAMAASTLVASKYLPSGVNSQGLDPLLLT